MKNQPIINAKPRIALHGFGLLKQNTIPASSTTAKRDMLRYAYHGADPSGRIKNTKGPHKARREHLTITIPSRLRAKRLAVIPHARNVAMSARIILFLNIIDTTWLILIHIRTFLFMRQFHLLQFGNSSR